MKSDKRSKARATLLPLLVLGFGTTVFARNAPMPATYTYKQVDDLKIQADVYEPAGEGTSRPVVVWIHGGALINGHRASVPRRLLTPLLEAGCVVVSIDYRLAPETKLPAIIADLEDAFRWVRGVGPDLFAADPERIAVMGGSAGGYLTLAAGHRVQPPPQALVPFWGYGDLIGSWYSEPSPHPRHRRTIYTREEAFAQVDGPPISDSRERVGNGGIFYQYCRQQGIWPKEVSTWDPKEEPERFFPYMPVKNVTEDYPPTLLIHGTDDTDVPYEQSVMMAAEFREHGVEHRLITVEHGEHGLAGADPAKVDAAWEEAIAFVLNRLLPEQVAGTSSRVRLSEWARGVSVDSVSDPEMRMYLWFYEWNMFEAMLPGQHTRGMWDNEVTVGPDRQSARVTSGFRGLSLDVQAVDDGAELMLTVTNLSEHDWPPLASVIACFNPGPEQTRNAAFANEQTYFVGADGLHPLTIRAPREIHFNDALRDAVDAESNDGLYVWSEKWPMSDLNATAGLIARESNDREWVTGIAWERFLSAQGHNPWECMHLAVRVGPLAVGETRKVRGKMYLFEGTREELLERYRRDF
jgi:acetyl esterase/lipase